jgi:N-acetylmuramoyl-L-alanine amidase
MNPPSPAPPPPTDPAAAVPRATARARLRRLAGLALLAPGLLAGAEPPARATPSRPGAAAETAPAARLPIRRIGRVEHVALPDAARALGLSFVATEQGRRATLKGPGITASFEAESREATLNGLRLFLGEPVALAGGVLCLSRADFERAVAPVLRPGFGLNPRPAPKVIVLDAGHGGHDPGRVNTPLKINEKTLTLDVARRARRLLEAEGFKVVLTRESDTFIALPQRAAAANLVQADAFVSIHFNALPQDAKTSGVEVYTFPPRGQRSTNSWSPGTKEDAEHHASPVHRADGWSALLAHTLHGRLVGDLKAADRGRKLMHLAVLRPLQAPGVLIECGFLTSDAEARRIATPEYRQQLAVALAAGIRDYARAVDAARRPPRASSSSSSR